MKKSELKTGDKITYRKGVERYVILGTVEGDVLCFNSGEFAKSLDSYNGDLTTTQTDFDIVKVERVTNHRFFDDGSKYQVVWFSFDKKKIEIQKELDALMTKAKEAGMNVSVSFD